MATDVFHAEFPKEDVTCKKHREQDQPEDWFDVVIDHQEPVEQSVAEGGDEETGHQIAEAAFLAELGQGEEVAHDDGEEEMSRDGKQGTDDAGSDAGAEGGTAGLEDIQEVFHTAEAEADEGRIDDAIKKAVNDIRDDGSNLRTVLQNINKEIERLASRQEEDDELAQFLAEAGLDECGVEDAIRIDQAVDDGHQQEVQRDGQDASEEG